MVVVLLCTALTVHYAGKILDQQKRSQESVEHLILLLETDIHD
jgi:hypothetical protein